MGTTNDCRAYIDKLAFFGTNYSPGSVILSASRGGYGDSEYYLDDAQRKYPQTHPARDARDALLSFGVPPALITFREGTNPSDHITQATNVAGYLTWGENGQQGGDYATNGTVRFYGSSAWFLIQTIESFNGQRTTYQGNFIDWFSDNAFGGVDYACTPVGAVSHVEEPLGNWNDAAPCFRAWNRGSPFAASAWESRKTPFFQAVGDPLVAK